MSFDPAIYSPEVSAILALDANGERLMPLIRTGCSSPHALELLQASSTDVLFPGSRAPGAALAGLYLYFSCWDEAHKVAQDIDTPDGSYWHAIVHRQEPDAGNASYWFRQVGSHPIFPALRDAAAALGVDFGPVWKPSAFVDLCERARLDPGSENERLAREVQRVEWQLLFHHCAAKTAGAPAS